MDTFFIDDKNMLYNKADSSYGVGYRRENMNIVTVARGPSFYMYMSYQRPHCYKGNSHSHYVAR